MDGFVCFFCFGEGGGEGNKKNDGQNTGVSGKNPFRKGFLVGQFWAVSIKTYYKNMLFDEKRNKIPRMFMRYAYIRVDENC